MSTESDCDQIPWADLPCTVTTNIFLYLKQSDRLNASIVCRNWETAFHSSMLWNTAMVWFDGNPPSAFSGSAMLKCQLLPNFRNEKAIKFAESNGRYLKDLRLRFYPGSEDGSSNLIMLMEKFIEKLADNECELHKLKIVCDLEIFIWKQEVKKTFKDIWMRFLRNQTHLKVIEFNYWWKYCIRILESAVAGSGSSLKSLKFSFESDRIPLNQLRKEHFVSLFSEMPNLENLEMPYECFSSSVLQNLIKNNSVLKCIKLNCCSQAFEFLIPSNIGIPPDEWKAATKKHPQLRVKLSGDFPLKLNSLPFMMPIFMPLSSLEIYIDEEITQGDWNNERFFTYLKNAFSETLEIFHYFDFRDTATEELTPHIKKFLLSCPKIKDLFLCIYKDEPISYIEDICKMQVENRIDIRKLYIHYHSNNAEDETTLNKIFELYKDRVGDRNWKFDYEGLSLTEEEIPNQQN